MWRAGIAKLTGKLIPLMLAVCSVTPQRAEGQTVTDVVLKSGSFLIPFNIGADGAPPREVHLYMASAADNVGPAERALEGEAATKNWRLLDRQSPAAGQFQVSKTPDGTFWFAIRTIDASGRPHPAGPIEPELKVIVDTTNPVVELTADADADGKMTASFSVDDATETSKMTAYYFTDTAQKWRSIPVERTQGGGKFAFEPSEPWRELSLRLRVIDGAGNETIVAKDRIQKPRVATTASTRFASSPLGLGNAFGLGGGPQGPGTGGLGVGPTNFPNFAQPGGPQVSSLAGNSPALPPPSTADQISNDFGRSSPTIDNLTSSAEATATAPETLAAPTGKPETPMQAMRPLAPPANSSGAAPQFAQPQSPSQPRGGSSEPSGGQASQPNSSEVQPQTPFFTESIPAPTGERPAPTQLNQPARTEVADLAASDDVASSPWTPIDTNRNPSRQFSSEPSLRPVERGSLRPAEDAPDLPRRARREPVADNNALDLERLSQRAVVRYSLSHQFSLDYEIEAIGGRGVDEIELYGTTDGGQVWKKWGDDPDKQSPFDIETSGEGIFGFQIVVVATNGLSSPRPLPGDAPDIVVVVDETLPEVGISGAKYGTGDRAGSLVIAFHCEDEYLVSRPITLSFSDSVSGPWTTIAAGLRNTGDYVWPADPQLPRQIYLRIDALDRADNVGSYVLEEPIDTQGLAPRARIRAFRSIPGR